MQRATHMGLAAMVLLWTLPAAGGAQGARSSSLGCETAHECSAPADRTYRMATGTAKDPGSAPAESRAYADYMADFACTNAVAPAYENATGDPVSCR